MIASLSGKVSQVEHNSIVVDVHGVGFQVFVPADIRESARPGDNITVYTYLVVRQDMLALYGFETPEAKEYFTLMLGVDGIGPRLALAVLSTLSPETIRRAVFHEQGEVFGRVPGVGKKTAQKMMLYLQDKIKTSEGEALGVHISDVDTEVLSALTTLGYSVVEAQAALQSIPRDAPQDVEERLRLALGYFS